MRTPDVRRSDWRRSRTTTSACVDGLEVLRSRRRAERLLQAVAGGRMADACARSRCCCCRTRHAPSSAPRTLPRWCSATTKCRRAHGGRTDLRIVAEALRRRTRWPRPRLASRHGSSMLFAHQRRQHAVGMRRVAPREASLHARMAVVGAAVRIGLHADQLIAFEFGVERTTDAAIRARGLHRRGRVDRARRRSFRSTSRWGTPARTRRTRRIRNR